MCCCESFQNWYHSPNKNWFKITKCILTILRAILFIVFSILSLYLKSKSLITQKAFIYPFVCLYASFIYNWRFLLSLVIVFFLFVVKIVELISFCCCVSLLTNRFTSKIKKFLQSLFRALHWSQLDWPCFLNLKYFLYIFDTIHYFLYFLSVIIIGCIELLSLKSDSDLVTTYFFNGFLFFIHIFVEIYRIVQSQRVESDIRDIFASDVNFSKKAVKMISEQQLGSRVCVNLSNTNCTIIDSEHRAFSHPKDIFKIKFVNVPLNKRGTNIMVGFHQTTIEAAKSILATSFKPSKTGMLGPGIYFANNYDITEHKRNQSTEGGAIFCAKIDMGKVIEVSNKMDNQDYSRNFNSKYLHHGGGDKFDEFVIYSADRIIEYTIIVEMDAIESYRKRNRKTYCNCINCL